MCIHHSLQQRVARQSVATMQTRAGTLAGRIKVMYRRLAIHIHLDASTLVVCRWPDGNHVLSDIDTQLQTLGIYRGESIYQFVLSNSSRIQIQVVHTCNLHLVVYGAGHNIAGSQRQTLIVLVHKLIPLEILQYCTCAAHGLSDEKSGLFGGIVQRCGVELHEFQVAQHAPRPMHHCHPVAGGDNRCGGSGVDVTHATGCQQSNFRQIGVNLICAAVQRIDAVTYNVGRVLGNPLAQMVLRYNIDSKLMLFQFNIGVIAHRLQQSTLYLGTGIILMVQNAEFRMASLSVQVKTVTGNTPVEINTILYQLAYAVGGLADGHLHHLAVADTVARHQRVLDMFIKTVAVVHHCGYTPLGIASRTLGSLSFAKDAHLSIRGHFQGKAQPCNT